MTVIGPRRRVDIALPTQVPFADLFPTIARFCGLDENDFNKQAGGWALQRLGQPPFGQSATPESEGLYDGELIYLRPKSSEMPAMESDDIADEIASIHDGPGRWVPTDIPKLAVGAATAGLLAGAVMLARSGPDWTMPAVLAGVMAIVLVVAAIAASRAAGQTVGATMLAATALPYAFIAGVAGIAATSHTGPPATFLHGTGLGALVGFALATVVAVVSVFGVGAGRPAFFGLAIAGGFGAIAALITFLANGALSAAGVAVVVAFLALGLATFLPSIAFRLAGLAMPRVPASADDLRNDALLAPQKDVKSRAVVADHVISGAVSGMALTCVGAEIALGFGHGWAPATTLAVLSCALLLQSRLFRGRIQRLALLGAGYAGLAWLAITYPHIWNIPAVLIGAGLVVGVGGWLPTHRPSPFWGRAADIVDVLLVIALLPLGLYVAGVLTLVQSIGG
ncbi:MAG: type VII secretion integral membrane protein EccD [Streptosporangiales bacterium]|nr:type VII secretion integral membrane protein EccD [Streptosporangiales bacterium]